MICFELRKSFLYVFWPCFGQNNVKSEIKFLSTKGSNYSRWALTEIVLTSTDTIPNPRFLFFWGYARDLIQTWCPVPSLMVMMMSGVLMTSENKRRSIIMRNKTLTKVFRIASSPCFSDFFAHCWEVCVSPPQLDYPNNKMTASRTFKAVLALFLTIHYDSHLCILLDLWSSE